VVPMILVVEVELEQFCTTVAISLMQEPIHLLWVMEVHAKMYKAAGIMAKIAQ